MSILSVAWKELGVHEVPMGSNRGGHVEKYQAATWLRGSGWPWCVAFCQWVYVQAGEPCPWRGAGAYAWLAWAKKAGYARPLPAKGRVAVFNIGSGHVALIESFSSTTVTTVGGNEGNAVRRETRPRSLVRGYIEPAWRQNPPKKKPRRKPIMRATGTAKRRLVWTKR